MSEIIDLEKISLIYNGNKLSSVPNTYKAFLELLRDNDHLTNEEFNKKTIYKGSFPILCKEDYINQLKMNFNNSNLIVDSKNDNDGNIYKKDYLQFLTMEKPDEILKIELSQEKKEDTVFIYSNVNEFYALTQVKQYYKNNNHHPVELKIQYHFIKEINFRKFTIKINDKIACSRILEKEKAKEKYSDTIACGNVGIYSSYTDNDSNSYCINVGNIAPGNMVELNSEFVQFLTSEDMSFCFSVMANYPIFSDGNSRNSRKKIRGNISIKTHSKITRIITPNFINDEYFTREFNQDYTSCDIKFNILSFPNNSKILNILFRTEKMNEPYLVSQYNPEKDETSYIFGNIYDQKALPVPEKPDTDININYYSKYQSDAKTETPSLFIFLIDQSGSMSGSPIKLVIEALLLFLQSLPKGSYFQLIGFGSRYVKINEKPVEYNKENVKSTMDKIKNLNANLGGTDIFTPLKYIFNNIKYNEINLGKNLFILTDGEVEKRNKCLGLISSNIQTFKIHSIGIGDSFDKKFILNAGLKGKGSYHFVNNISDISSVIIQSLSKCLRKYISNVKINLDKIKPEYEFTPKMNFIYPDEIIYYYFIVKGNNINETIQINLESSDKKENLVFSNDKIIKENKGELIGQIIIGNILKNSEITLDENLEIKLSKNYQVLSNRTSLFAIIEGDDSNKIGELIPITTKEKPWNYYNGIKFTHYNHDNGLKGFRGRGRGRDRDKGRRFDYGNFENINRGMIDNYNTYNNQFINPTHYNKKNYSYINNSNRKYNHEGQKVINLNDYLYYDSLYSEKESYLDNNICGLNKPEIKYKKPDIEGNKDINFSLNELVLTQDIFDGFWDLNPQTNLLIEKEKKVYEKIENIMKERNVNDQRIKVTLLVLYYLKSNNSINKIEYSLIIKKGINFLENNGINYKDFFS